MKSVDSSSQDRQAGVMALTPIANMCGSGSCPTVYTTDRGSVLVQGFVVPAANVDQLVPDGEMLVEVPAELLREAVSRLA